MAQTYKICFIGGGGVGKTAFVKRMLTGKFTTKYVPTVGVEVHPLKFTTTYGEVILNIWDTAGQENLGGLRDGYYIQASAAVVFADVSSRRSFEEARGFAADFRRIRRRAPIIYCGSKSDIRTRKISEREVQTSVDYRDFRPYYEISAKTCHNHEHPFLHILREVTGHHDLQILEYGPNGGSLQAEIPLV